MRSRVLALLLIISLGFNGFQFLLYTNLKATNSKLKDWVLKLSEENKALSQQIAQLNSSIRMLISQLSYYRKIAEKSIQKEFKALEKPAGSAEVSIVAVRIAGPWWSQKMEGVVMKALVEVRPGEGGVYVRTTPYIGIDLQSSLNNAISAVESLTGRSLKNLDVFITISAKEEVEIVDGPSAGAPLAAAILAAVEGKKLRQDVVATGVIYPDGTIGRVGGVPEKAKAAAEMGAKIFAVPSDQSRVVIMVPKTREIAPGFYITTYQEKVISLEQYLKELGYEIEVVEVSSLEQLIKLMISG